MFKRTKAVFPGGLAWAMRQRPDELVLRRLSDGSDYPAESIYTPVASPAHQTLDTLLAAGPRADRRACPDLARQLAAIQPGAIDTIICNLVDHEPVVQLNGVLARQFPQALATMAAELQRLAGASRVIIAVNESARAFHDLRDAARDRRVEVIGLESRYPQAHVTLLLYSLLKLRLPPQNLPTDLGALVVDGPALWMLWRCREEGRWPAEVPIAVRDHVRGECRYWVTPVGTSLGRLLEAGSLVEGWRAGRIGDLLRGVEAKPDMELGDGELVLHLINPPGDHAPGDAPCVRCGWCVDHCPVAANPAILLEAAQQDDLALAFDGGIDACIECGVCDHVCPSELPLAEAIRTLKNNQQPDGAGSATLRRQAAAP